MAFCLCDSDGDSENDSDSACSVDECVLICVFVLIIHQYLMHKLVLAGTHHLSVSIIDTRLDNQMSRASVSHFGSSRNLKLWARTLVESNQSL